MEQKIKLRKAERPEITYRREAHLTVTEETHAKVKAAAFRSGYRMKDMAELLVSYALENIEWEDNEKI